MGGLLDFRAELVGNKLEFVEAELRHATRRRTLISHQSATVSNHHCVAVVVETLACSEQGESGYVLGVSSRQGQRSMRESPMKVDRRAEIGEQREPESDAVNWQKCAYFWTSSALPAGR